MNPFEIITEQQWSEHCGLVIAVDRNGRLGIVAKGSTYQEAEAAADQYNILRAATGEEHVHCTLLAVPRREDFLDLEMIQMGHDVPNSLANSR